jgi:hypothetical protein
MPGFYLSLYLALRKFPDPSYLIAGHDLIPKKSCPTPGIKECCLRGQKESEQTGCAVFLHFVF